MSEDVFEHEGFKCLVLKGPMSNNGYVAIPPGHPWSEKHYDDIPADVHGGLTFSVRGGEDEKWPGEDLWWIGFDTAHYNSGYWSKDQVADECRRLAEQAKAAK